MSVIHPNERALLRALDFGVEDPHVLDVGANVGEYTREVLLRWPAARVDCYEPLPAAAAALRGQGWPPTVTIHEAPLSSWNETVVVHHEGASDMTASIHRRSVLVQTQELTCEALRLDASGTALPIHLLKVDVEGHELEVLRGAGHHLDPAVIHVIQFEFNDCNLDSRTFVRDFWELLAPAGYALFVQVPGGGLERIESYVPALEDFHAHREFVAMDPGCIYWYADRHRID